MEKKDVVKLALTGLAVGLMTCGCSDTGSLGTSDAQGTQQGCNGPNGCGQSDGTDKNSSRDDVQKSD